LFTHNPLLVVRVILGGPPSGLGILLLVAPWRLRGEPSSSG
jgi:hypothetical protein